MRNKILSIFKRNRYEKIAFYEDKNRKNDIFIVFSIFLFVESDFFIAVSLKDS